MTNNQVQAVGLTRAHASSLPFAQASQDVLADGVRALFGTAAQARLAQPQPELSGTGFTYRHDWGARHGEWLLRLNWAAVGPQSRVLVAVAEGTGGIANGKFIGAARYTLHNVAPRAGGVDVWVDIAWPEDIALYVDYLVINP